jgi:predicted CoA-binding protein
MNEPETIARILKECRVVAVVGLSEKPERPSYGVAGYLIEKGYRVIPINPAIPEWKGMKSYPDLKSVPEKIDVVDIFRRSEFVNGIVMDAIAIHAKAVWMQEDVIDEKAVKLAEKAGLLVVMDRCMMKEHARLFP